MKEENKNIKGDNITFDDILTDKEYQAEFDRRVTKALETQKAKLEKDFKKELSRAEETFKEEKTEEIKKQFLAEKEQLEEELTKVEKKNIIDKAILKSGTHDELAVKAHLSSFLEEAEFKDGEIVGLDEKLNSLKEEKKYLFENTVGTGVKHKQPLSSNEPTLEEDIANKIFNKQ